MTVLAGSNNTTATVATGTLPFTAPVNPITNKIYVANLGGANVTVITPAPTNAIPLNTAITPAAGNTTNQMPTFSLTATSTYAPNAPPPQNIYFQMDTTNGAFTKAVNQSSTATTLTANATTTTLQPGIHIIYFFASDGSDATSINPNRPFENNFGKLGFVPEASPIIGGINAYLFLVVAAPLAANVSLGGQVLTANGNAVGKVYVSLTDTNGETRTVISNPFGYYNFADVPAGETYIIAARHKRYIFAPQIVNVSESVSNLNLVAQP